MASYFLRAGYGKLKGLFAAGGLITGLGGVAAGTVLIVGGTTLIGALIVTMSGFGTVNACFNIIDVKSWLEMKKSIDELEKVRKTNGRA